MVPGSMEIVHEGMLKKSPPPKRLWRAKWRMRWFVLRSGELPGQYVLEYYTDQTRRKLKGTIDLDQCDQVDAGITFANRKLDYKYMFDIKTPKRVYYLCAETEQEMNRWVDCVCQVCGLKIYSQEDYPPMSMDHLSPTPPSATPPTPMHSLAVDHPALDSPSLSPSSPGSSISGPYIPISTCFTGKRTPNNNSSFPFGDDIQPLRVSENHRSSIPNEMAPPVPMLSSDSQPPLTQAPSPPSISTGAIPRESYDSHRQLKPSGTTSEETLSAKSPLGTDGSSVFSEDEMPPNAHKVDTRYFNEGSRALSSSSSRDAFCKEGHWEGQGNPAGVSSGATGSVGTLATDVRGKTLDEDHHLMTAPPRPPKPAHLAEPHHAEALSKTSLVRRNSSTEKVKNGVSTTFTVNDAGAAAGPEPSPVSVCSSLPPSSPQEVSEEAYGAMIRSQQLPEAVSPHSADRVKQRHCYNNFVPTPKQHQVFSYDVRHHENTGELEPLDPRISPVGIYSNIGQANKSPPAVNRCLKPRKNSEVSNLSASDLSSPLSGGGIAELMGAVGGSPVPPSSAPPAVDRNLKPMKNPPEPISKAFVLDPAPTRLMKHNQRKPRAAPSPTPPSMHNGRGNPDSGEENELVSTPDSRRNSSNTEEQIFFPLQSVSRFHQEVQYLCLDHEAGSTSQPIKGGASKNIIGASAPSVVYKTVDFLKTEAFNKMRINVEDTYRKNQ